MVTGFIIENQTTKERVTFGQTPKYDYLFKSDGLDWGYAPATHSTYTYAGQVGEYDSITNITGREITITGYISYVPTQVDLSNYDLFSGIPALIEQKIKEKKRKLNGLINPKDYLRITIGNFYIEGKPTRSIQYGNTYQENNEVFCMFVINVHCFNPMFHKVVAPNTVVSGASPAWHFPLEIPNTGFQFSTRTDYLVISVENEGDNKVGGIITLEATGEVKNPAIENIETGESFTIYKTMQRGEKIVIDTREGDSRGIKGGIGEPTQNYFKYWDFENVWLQFGIGSNLVGYSTENGSELLLNVTVEIKPEKFAVEEQ